MGDDPMTQPAKQAPEDVVCARLLTRTHTPRRGRGNT